MGTEYIYIYTYSHILEYDYVTKEKTNKGYKRSVNMSRGGKEVNKEAGEDGEETEECEGRSK